MIINCDYHDWAPTDLWFMPADARDNGSVFDLPVDHEKIKLASKNVYNITNLAYNDSGLYLCIITIANTTNTIIRERIRYNLTVLREGKTCIDYSHKTGFH